MENGDRERKDIFRLELPQNGNMQTTFGMVGLYRDVEKEMCKAVQ